MTSTTQSKPFLIAAALFALAATLLGAFTAHALRATLTVYQLNVFQTGIFYQFIHSLALFGIGLLVIHMNERLIRISGYLFILGILLFSGSLYLMSVLKIKWLGVITPIGGLSFIIGWFLLTIGIYKTE